MFLVRYQGVYETSSEAQPVKAGNEEGESQGKGKADAESAPGESHGENGDKEETKVEI